MYKYIRNLWKKPSSELLRARLIKWRKEESFVKIDKPTNIARARQLGYKAKQGYIVVRVKLPRGGRMRPLIKKGRRSKHRRRLKILGKNYQQVAEERASSKFVNLEVLNSYKLAKDGKHYWFEVILVDPNHPVIKSDKKIIRPSLTQTKSTIDEIKEVLNKRIPLYEKTSNYQIDTENKSIGKITDEIMELLK